MSRVKSQLSGVTFAATRKKLNVSRSYERQAMRNILALPRFVDKYLADIRVRIAELKAEIGELEAES
jgi:hypothetical protein